MNKIFKTALTLAALLGMVRDGWGTTSVTLNRFCSNLATPGLCADKNCIAKYSNKSGSTYTLKDSSNGGSNRYTIQLKELLQTTSALLPTLVISSPVFVTYDSSTELRIGDQAKLINQGTFSTTAGKTLQLTGGETIGGTIENKGIFTNNGILIGNKNTHIKNNSGTFANDGTIKVVYNSGAGPLTIAND